MAFRVLEGDAAINFGHRSHTWQKCGLRSNFSGPVGFAPDEGTYVVNEWRLDGIFQILPEGHTPHTSFEDLDGGSSKLVFTSPLTGDVLTSGEFPTSALFGCDVRDFCSQALGHPPFAITFVHGGSVVAQDAAVESVAGHVGLILRPIKTAWNRKLLRAIQADDAEVAQDCLYNGQDPDTSFPNGFTALAYSANHAAMSCLTVLLRAKASPNMRGLNGNTALHHAVYTGHMKAVQLLLQYGAKAGALDAGGTSCAHWASQAQGFAGPVMLTCLAEANADLHLQDKDLDTPFALASSASSNLSVIMTAVWDRLRWLDLLVRHEYSLAGFVNTKHLQLACRTTTRRFSWSWATSTPPGASVDVFGGSSSTNIANTTPGDRLGGADAPADTETVSALQGPIIRGMKYAYFRFFVAPLVPTLNAHPHLNSVLPSPLNTSDDKCGAQAFLQQLLHITFVIATVHNKDSTGFYNALSTMFDRVLKTHPSIREYIFSCPSLRTSSGQKGAARRIQLLFLLSLPLPLSPAALLKQNERSDKPLQDISIEVQHRVSLFEGLCCDYKALLCLRPGLWCVIPNPFSFLDADSQWEAALGKAGATFSTISAFLSHQLPTPDANALARADKRLKVYIGYMRKHMVNILKEPQSAHQVLNPCDSSIPKRAWEVNLTTMRQRWSCSECAEMTDTKEDDVIGGSNICEQQQNDELSSGQAYDMSDSAALLRHAYMFGRPLQTTQEAACVSSRLRDFYAAMRPLSGTLQQFPSTFWILPIPFHTDEKETDWQIRLECCALFLWLIRDSKASHLEALLITFYWPEIQANPALLDVVSTSILSVSLRDRIKKLVFAWLSLHTLSSNLSSQPERHIPTSMPRDLVYRYVRVYRALRDIRPFKKHDKRTRYIAALGDICGGAWHDVTAASAVTGEALFPVSCELAEAHSFLDLVRVQAAAVFSAPYFCFDVLRGDSLLDDQHTWADLGYPNLVHLVVKPKVLDWTENLFDAIEDGNVQDVQKFLKMGQDPDCTMMDSALCAAAERNHYPIVELLIRAGANVNYIPMGRPGPLQTAVISDAEGCATLLLRSHANPNLCDGTAAANTPLHLAAVYGDAAFTHILLSHGADPMLPNAHGSSPVALATPGIVVALCLAECSADEVDPATFLVRHVSILATMGCPASFWATCKVLSNHRQNPHSDLEGGSSISASRSQAIDSTRWVRLCLNRAKALEKSGKRRKSLQIMTWKG